MKTNPAKMRALVQIERAIGHTFADQRLLVRALTHRSFSGDNNERFEFIGDAVLDMPWPKCCLTLFPN